MNLKDVDGELCEIIRLDEEKSYEASTNDNETTSLPNVTEFCCIKKNHIDEEFI